MRKLLLLLHLAFCLQILPGISQNRAYPNAIQAKLNFVDYGLLFNNDPRISQGFEVAYFRNVAPALNVGVPLKFGQAKLPGTDNGNTRTVSADLQFRLENMNGKSIVTPFLFAGAGYMFEKSNNHVQFPFGVGLNFRISPFAYINLQGEFRKALVEDRDNLQLGIGFNFLMHKSENKGIVPQTISMDMDKDGTPDSLDLCPTLAGPAATQGCPDADNDGLADTEDDCPQEAGTRETKGCPDYDMDGFADRDDECPTEAGVLKGCPDSDFDGVADKDDKCPNEKGSVGNMGCPESKDSDGDGTPDDRDLCPDKAGPNRGCPDTDGDGIADNYDFCPEVAGTIANNGCPDTDGDGIVDKDDNCPSIPGVAANHGCPALVDTDGDGFTDDRDPCPTIAGPINGCPQQAKDTDGDGVPDENDKCPQLAGSIANKGCPEEKLEIKEVRAKLTTAARAVQFESAKAILKDASYDVLDEVVTIMRQNPAYSLSISGFTDNEGDDQDNFKLSQDRAKACYDYFLFRGVKAERIRFTGFGEARPIASNDTAEGREQNRRVEFELIVE